MGGPVRHLQDFRGEYTLKKNTLYLTCLHYQQTWLTYLTFLRPTWLTYLTDVPPDLPTWRTYLTYLLVFPPWPSYPTFIPHLPHWPSYRCIFLTGPSKIFVSVRLHSKSHQKSSKCQNLLTGWHLLGPVKKCTLYLTYLLPTWPTYLTYLHDLPARPTCLTDQSDMPTWPTYLKYRVFF